MLFAYFRHTENTALDIFLFYALFLSINVSFCNENYSKNMCPISKLSVGLHHFSRIGYRGYDMQLPMHIILGYICLKLHCN